MTDILNRPIKDCKIGVAGCGAMGFPMLKQLLQAGFNGIGYDIRPASDYVGFEQHMAADAEAFGSQIDILISVVRDRAQTEGLFFKDQKVFTNDTYPRIVIMSSTLSPGQFSDLAETLPPDVIVLDAPMSGAPIRAINGTLTFMVGGAPEQFEYLRPLFQAMGEKITHTGPAASGMAIKVLNNYVAACSTVAVRRVLGAARTHGLDQAMMLDVMKASSGATWFGDNFDAIDWSRQRYEDGNTIAILEKDVTCALETLGEQGAPKDSFNLALLEALRNMAPFEGKPDKS
ncbi:MAG: NAD(P)-dependent oxidoreductase [Rhizobiales bacterium]|nr:NAD(P)-dependent oxidoreductase [Hyphomicrobiales bacterium]